MVRTFQFNLFLFLIRIILVSGLGFGIISGAFAFVNVLSDMTGPGTFGINGQTQTFFISSCK